MFCTGCGKQIPDGAKFCPFCGGEQAVFTMPAAPAAPAGQQARAFVPAQQAAQQAPAPQMAAAPMPQQVAQQPPAQQQVASGPRKPGSETAPQPGPYGQYHVIENYNGKRSELVLQCRSGAANAVAAAEQVLSSNGFHRKDYSGEQVWKKGTGLATAMQFVKVMTYGDCLWLQAWVQSGIGDVGLSEMSLEGVFGAMPKKSCKKVVEKIRSAV